MACGAYRRLAARRVFRVHDLWRAGMIEKAWEGHLETSFQSLGRLCMGVLLNGHPDVGETNGLLEKLKGKRIKLLLQEVEE